jgi:thiol-disulfide isomerase/thioredoxin
MKRIAFLLIFCSLFFTWCKTSRPVVEISSSPSPEPAGSSVDSQHTVNYSEQSTWLIGYFSQGQLRSEPHSVWFYNGYDDYQVNQDALNRLQGIDKEGVRIKIVMGTWCPDSRREVPRFMRVLDMWNLPSGMVTFLGVDNGKLCPVAEYGQLEINRVPTFIIYKNNIEAGRIIENPVTSLEQDMVNILGGMRNNK